MELIIVTGLSGAGKSVAVKAFEDIGFYCIDNIPPAVIVPVAQLSNGQTELTKVAVTVDIRGGEMLKDLTPTLSELDANGIQYKILFLDAENNKLVTRFKETRRAHPLMANNSSLNLLQSVEKEREVLEPLKRMADYIIDTTNLSTAALKKRIVSVFHTGISDVMSVQCISFGFKYGSVPEADLVFDVRCLKNPFYVPELRPLTGLDNEIADFVKNLPETEKFTEKLFDLIDYMIPLYSSEGKSQLVIAIGCTGGKHRSVYFAEVLQKHLSEKNYRTIVSHRDITKDK